MVRFMPSSFPGILSPDSARSGRAKSPNESCFYDPRIQRRRICRLPRLRQMRRATFLQIPRVSLPDQEDEGEGGNSERYENVDDEVIERRPKVTHVWIRINRSCQNTSA